MFPIIFGCGCRCQLHGLARHIRTDFGTTSSIANAFEAFPVFRARSVCKSSRSSIIWLAIPLLRLYCDNLVDLPRKRSIMRSISGASADAGCAVLYSDSGWILQDGRLVSDGMPADWPSCVGRFCAQKKCILHLHKISFTFTAVDDSGLKKCPNDGSRL